MSWRAAFLSLPLALALAGCTQRDPVWELPCEERPAREVVPGTGEGEFDDLAEGPVPIQYGDQGGSHLWFSVRLRGFGPTASIQFGVVDADDPAVVYAGPLVETEKLSYNSGEEASEARGMFAFLGDYDEATMTQRPSPSGKKVLFWADVNDECTPEAVHGESAGKVE